MKKEARVASRDLDDISGSCTKSRLENNNSGNDVVDTDYKMPEYCPRCRHYSMYPAGQIRAGPRGGLRTVYLCQKCGYRKIH
jgi:hypothetical protein